MKRITNFTQKDIDSFKKVKDGYSIPDHFEVYQRPTRKEQLEAELSQNQSLLEKVTEPSTEDLIAEGRSIHPYYTVTDRISEIQAELTKLSK